MTSTPEPEGRPWGITSEEREAIRQVLHFAVPQLDLLTGIDARGELEYACAVLTLCLERLDHPPTK
jgi:hypothetical protein